VKVLEDRWGSGQSVMLRDGTIVAGKPAVDAVDRTATYDPNSLFWGGLANRWSELQRTISVDLTPVGLFRAAGFDADDWQHVLLTSTVARLYGLTTRQAGKSQTGAGKVLGWAMAPDQTIVVGSPTFRQSARLLARARVMYRRISQAYDGADIPKITNRALDRIEFDHGSQILALPANPDGIRGETAHNGLIDEASFCPRIVRDVISPMLASTGGQLCCLSSAGIEGTWFHQEWLDTERPNAARVSVTWRDVPRISKEFVDQERRSMTAARFAQEYECAWGSAAGSMFQHDDIKRLIVPEVQGLVVPAADWS
jgi:hypothetical protein